MKKTTLNAYPRMTMVRDSYLSLNGKWEYAIRKTREIPLEFDGTINVPFSPESPLSGVNRRVDPDDYLFYKKKFNLPVEFVKEKVYLHFSAVDQISTVILNGHILGVNKSGFLPFSFEISEYLYVEDNTLFVIVEDFTDTKFYSRGKQKLKRGNIWYTPQSGIYLPVWLESTPEEHIKSLKITPLYDEGSVEIVVNTTSSGTATLIFNATNYAVDTNTPFKLIVEDFISWSPTNPHLYPFVVKFGGDEVSSYFAMRKVHVGVDNNGIKRIFLNNEVFFQSGLLDQGYYHEGYLTPPDEETLVNDIKSAKAMGFNVLRKHIKIEWERFYYHCDKLGMLVWQDFVNGGRPYKFLTVHLPAVLNINYKDTNYKRFSRTDKAGRDLFYDEARRTIEYLYNYPSIILWTVFNEGWGQFDAHKLLPFVESLDNTRLIDITSGWHDQGIGDFKSLHVYFRPYKFRKDPLDRAVILSEFGGYAHKVVGHFYTRANFGYKKFKTKEALTNAFVRLYEGEIIPAVSKGLCAAIYTQLSDVEDELNGLLTYDRKIVKIDAAVVRAINAKLTG